MSREPDGRLHVLIARFLPRAHVSTVLADQALISAANFLGGILFVRFLGLHELGRFALAWMVAEFLASMQFAAIIQPMLNIGPKQSVADTERYYAAVKVQQGIFGLGAALIVLAVILVADQFFGAEGFAELAIPLAVGVAAYQAHAFVRRYLFLRQRSAIAFSVDMLRFGLQLGGTLLVGMSGLVTMNAATALWIVALAAVAGALPGLLFLGDLRPGRAMLVAVTRRHWHFSKWLMPSALMYWLSGQTFFIVAGIALGATAVGIFNVAKTVVGVLNILLLALDNFAPAQAARAIHGAGPEALYRFLIRLAATSASLIILIIVAIGIDPEYIVRIIYGGQYDNIGIVIRLIGIAYLPYTMNAVLVIWAAATEATKTIFVSQALAALFTVIAAYPLAMYGGIRGLALGTILAEVIRLIYLFTRMWRSRVRPTLHHPPSIEIVTAEAAAKACQI